MTQEEVNKAREQSIVKSNLFIQKAKYSLTLNQNKTLNYIISLVKPATAEGKQEIREYLNNGKPIDESKFQLTYGFYCHDIIRVFGWSKSGKTYKEIKDNVKAIADVSAWLPLANGELVLERFIEKPKINPKTGYIEVKIGSYMIPHLFCVENFTSSQQYDMLNATCVYSERLYSYLKSFHDKEISVSDKRSDAEKLLKPKKIRRRESIDYLKEIFEIANIATYNHAGKFKEKVLEPAIRDINLYTPLNVSYSSVKNGKKITHIEFVIWAKVSDEHFQTMLNNMRLLEIKDRQYEDGEQLELDIE